MAITVPANMPVVTPADLLGIVTTDSQPLKKLGELCNYLYAKHSPPLVNCAPFYDLATTYTFTIPCEPSVDGLNYVARFGLYAATTHTPTVTISGNHNAASKDAAQPGTPGDWTTLTGPVNLPITATTETWVDIPVFAIPSGVTLLRFVMTGGASFHPASIMVHPNLESAIASGPKVSGVFPFNDSILSVVGAPQYIEILNRLRRNAALIVRDREQVCASVAGATNVSRIIITSGGVAGLTKKVFDVGGYMPGQIGGLLRVRVYAYDTIGGAKLTVGIQGGDAVQFTIASNGSTFRRQEKDLRVATERPQFYADYQTTTGNGLIGAVTCAFKPGI